MSKFLKRFFYAVVFVLIAFQSSYALNKVALSAEYFPNPTIGRPISGALIYVGIVDLDPEIVANQKQISILQESGDIVEVSQPLETGAGGVVLYNGSPVTMYVKGSYSLKVLSKHGSQLYYIPTSDSSTEAYTSIENIGSLRSIEYIPNDGENITVLGYYLIGDGGGGVYYWDSDNTSEDNSGTIIKVTSIEVGRWLRPKTNEIKAIEFGVGLSGSDDIEKIDLAINATPEPGILSFPRKTINISSGFMIDRGSIVVNLNGAKFKATTTFDQPLPPGKNSAMLGIGSTVSGIKMAKIVINGDGAVFDGRRDEQIDSGGGIPGYNIIKIESSGGAIESDRLNIQDVVINDVYGTDDGYDGVYINGCKNVKLNNVVVEYSRRLGSVLIDGEDVVFTNCGFNYCRGIITNSGAGVWNEPNETWNEISAEYHGCVARYNNDAGFKLWSPGVSTNVNVNAYNCIAEYNGWDIETQSMVDRPANGAFDVRTNVANLEFQVGIHNCISRYNSTRSLLISTASGTTEYGSINVDNFISYDDSPNQDTGQNGARIYIDNSGLYNISLKNPTVLVTNYTSGMLGIVTDGDSTRIKIENPNIIGGYTASEKIVYNNIPIARLAAGEIASVLDKDRITDITNDDSSQFLPIVRPPVIDQEADPSSDMIIGELGVWSYGVKEKVIYKNLSGNSRYINTSDKLIRVVSSSVSTTITPLSSTTIQATATGSKVGDIVNVSLTTSLSGLILTGYVDTDDNVRWVLFNPTGSAIPVSGFLTAIITDSN